jgi:hypothetical protein
MFLGSLVWKPLALPLYLYQTDPPFLIGMLEFAIVIIISIIAIVSIPLFCSCVADSWLSC